MFFSNKKVIQSETNFGQRKRLPVSEKIILGNDLQLRSSSEQNVAEQMIYLPCVDGGIKLTEKILSKHLLLLGGIGSGKTNVINFIIEALLHQIEEDDVLLIFDTKGDYKELFFDPDNSNHILIGTDKSYRKISKSWNIFSDLRDSSGQFDERESMLVAKEISKQLFIDRGSSSQPFFVRAAEDIVSKILIHMLREAQKVGKADQLNTADFVSCIRNSTIIGIYNMLIQESDFRSATSYLGINSKGGQVSTQGIGVVAEINSMVNDLFWGPFGEHNKNGSIGIRELIRKKNKKVIFIEYDLSIGELITPMYRIIFDLALKQALGGRNTRGNTYFIIDEASLLPNLLHLQDALNFGRSLGVKVIAGLQSISQWNCTYGKEKGNVIAAGFMNAICFQTMDLESRKFISARFGSNYQNLSYIVDGTLINERRNGNVVEDWDVMGLDPGEAFVNLIDSKPIMFKCKFQQFKSDRILDRSKW